VILPVHKRNRGRKKKKKINVNKKQKYDRETDEEIHFFSDGHNNTVTRSLRVNNLEFHVLYTA